MGKSGTAVYRLARPQGPDLYLKHGQDAAADDVTDEMARLRWLARHVPVPNVLYFVCGPREAWLLMSAAPGRTAYQMLHAQPDGRAAVVDALARFMGRLHAIAVEDCPFNSGHVLRLAHARQRVEAGLVDVGDFDEERQALTAAEVWRQTTELLPFTPDPVVTHGDFSLDNLLLAGNEVSCCIDVGRAGVADRYQDLAVLWHCLGDFGAPLQRRLLDSYGIRGMDERKLRFHLLLDELF